MKVKIQMNSNVDVSNAANAIQNTIQDATGLMCHIRIIQNKAGSIFNDSNNSKI